MVEEGAQGMMQTKEKGSKDTVSDTGESKIRLKQTAESTEKAKNLKYLDFQAWANTSKSTPTKELTYCPC